MATGNTFSAFSSQSEVQLLSMHEIDISHKGPHISCDIDALVASVRERGIDTPLIVRKIDSTEKDKPHGHKLYEIIDGKARWTCAVRLEIETLPAIIVQMSEEEARHHRYEHDREKRLQRVFGVGLDQTTDALSKIAGMIESKRALQIEIDELDGIADDRQMEIMLNGGCYWLDDILTTLNWWRCVSDTLLGSKDGDHELCPYPAFAHHREVLLKLLNDTLAAFTPAWQADYRFSVDWIEGEAAPRELLKRYRTFTRYVCTFAQELWPEVNMDPLLKRA